MKYLSEVLECIVPEKEYDENIHIIPTGEYEHDETEACWCSPYHDPQNRKELESGLATRKVIIHRRIKEILQ